MKRWGKPIPPGRVAVQEANAKAKRVPPERTVVVGKRGRFGETGSVQMRVSCACGVYSDLLQAERFVTICEALELAGWSFGNGGCSCPGCTALRTP